MCANLIRPAKHLVEVVRHANEPAGKRIRLAAGNSADQPRRVLRLAPRRNVAESLQPQRHISLDESWGNSEDKDTDLFRLDG
jgi:hypothetical protein